MYACVSPYISFVLLYQFISSTQVWTSSLWYNVQIRQHTTIRCPSGALPIQQWPVEKLSSFHAVPGEPFNTTLVITPARCAVASANSIKLNSSVHTLMTGLLRYTFIKKLTCLGICCGEPPQGTYFALTTKSETWGVHVCYSGNSSYV